MAVRASRGYTTVATWQYRAVYKSIVHSCRNSGSTPYDNTHLAAYSIEYYAHKLDYSYLRNRSD